MAAPWQAEALKQAAEASEAHGADSSSENHDAVRVVHLEQGPVLASVGSAAAPGMPICGVGFQERKCGHTKSSVCLFNVDDAVRVLRSIIRYDVRRAEQRLLAGNVSSEDLAILLHWQQDVLTPLCHSFAYALPTERALSVVARHGSVGVVEMGAGQGLWTALLRRRGVCVHAFDRGPEGATFSQVLDGGPDAVAAFPNHALLLCWPPLETEIGCSDSGDGGGDSSDDVEHSACESASASSLNLMALSSVRAMVGDGALIYIGEWQHARGVLSQLSPRTRFGQTAGEHFQRYVETHFDVIETAPLPRWPGFADQLIVFRRKRTQLDLHTTSAHGSTLDGTGSTQSDSNVDHGLASAQSVTETVKDSAQEESALRVLAPGLDHHAQLRVHVQRLYRHRIFRSETITAAAMLWGCE